MKPSDPEKAAEAVSIIDAHYLATFGTERRDAINRLIAAARTPSPDAVREALGASQRLLADLTGGDPNLSVQHLWARAVKVELQARKALSPKPAGAMRSGGAAIEPNDPSTEQDR